MQREILTLPRVSRAATASGYTLAEFGDQYALYDSDGDVDEYGTLEELWGVLRGSQW